MLKILNEKFISLKFYEFIDVVCMNVSVLSNFLKNFWTQCNVLPKWLYNLCLPERLRACQSVYGLAQSIYSGELKLRDTYLVNLFHLYATKSSQIIQ